MNVAFAGTRRGMSAAQKARVGTILQASDIGSHGDCTGADEDFHQLCILAGIRDIIIRPGLDRLGRSPWRAYCDKSALTLSSGIQCHVVDPEPYLKRNDKIVAWGEVLIATPKGWVEEWRKSGTWAAIRHAALLQRPIQIVYPDGTVRPYTNERRAL